MQKGAFGERSWQTVHMADSSLERKKKLVAEFEQIVRKWPSGKPGVAEVIEYLEKEKKNLQAMTWLLPGWR